MKHYLLFYEAGADYEERRRPFRAVHLEHARSAVARNELILGGALANPIDGAVLLFRGDSPAAAERFAQGDPYVVNGVAKKWYVREWTTVVGTDAEIQRIATPHGPLPAGTVATTVIVAASTTDTSPDGPFAV